VFGLLLAIVCALCGLPWDAGFAADPARATDVDRYGVNLYFGEDRTVREPIRRQFQAMGAAGIRWARTDFSREELHRGPGKYEWDRMDFIVAQAARHGIHVLGVLGESPSWDTTGQGTSYYTYPPRRYDQWADYVYQTVRRYKGQVHFWEVWNEEDAARPKGDWAGTPAEFARLLATASQQVRRADPNAKVVLGGFVGGSFSDSIRQSIPFLKAILGDRTYPAGKYFDIMNVHTYGTRTQARAQVTQWLETMQEVGLRGVPLWVTEVGWPSDQALQARRDPEFCCGEAAKARYLLYVMPELLALGADRVFWWPLWLPGQGDYGQFRTYGLLDFQLNPTPAYFALKELLAKLAK
jgi:GH35 family endo-1,4-beta-xylanase